MAHLSSLAIFLFVSLAFAQEQFYNNAFDQELNYGGSGSPGSGVGSVPTVPAVPSVPTYDPTPSTPSYGGGSGDGSVPSVPSYGGGSGGVPSVDPSGGGGVPTVPSGGGFPTVPSSGGIPTVPSSGGIPGGGIPIGGTPSANGCSCDFWAAHVNSWPDPLQLVSTISAIFGGLASNAFPNTTLLTALRQQKTDPYSQLLRQGTAAMINSYARPNFQYTPQQVRTHFNAALSSATAAATQAAKFANANRGYGTNTFCT